MPIINSSYFGSGGTDTSDATAVASQILAPYTAYVASGKVTGTMPSQGAQTITPGTTNKTIQSGRYLSGTQTILGDAQLIPSNIRRGVDIFGVVGTLETVSYLMTNNGGITINSGDNTIVLQGEWAFVSLRLTTPTGGSGLLLIVGAGDGYYIPGYDAANSSFSATSETSSGITTIGFQYSYDIVFPDGISQAGAYVWNSIG